MTLDFTLGIFTTALGILAAVMLGGFGIFWTQLHHLSTRMDDLETKLDAIPAAFVTLRHELADEFRSQRAEVAAQTTALANAIVAARN